MDNDFDVMDSDLDYTAEAIDDAVVDNSSEAITEPEGEYSEQFSSTLSEDIKAVTSSTSIMPITTQKEVEFQTLASQMAMSQTQNAMALATPTQAPIKSEEKKPIYKNPLVIGAGLLALFYMMGDD